MSPRLAAAFTVAALVADAEEFVVFAGPEAKVAIRATDGGYPLDVDCENVELAERLRQAVTALIPGEEL